MTVKISHKEGRLWISNNFKLINIKCILHSSKKKLKRREQIYDLKFFALKIRVTKQYNIVINTNTLQYTFVAYSQISN